MSASIDNPARRPLATYLKTPAWATGAGPDGDVVLAARARFARNLHAYPFPAGTSERAGDLRRVAQEVRRAALADGERLADLSPVAVGTLSQRDRADLVDARRISPELGGGGGSRWALLDEAGAVSLFVNEEDHVRIQTLAPGNAVEDVLRRAEDVDARLARRLVWAWDDRWGYLTASLSNMGTGLRLSLLVHLPALAFLGRLPETLHAARYLGISIRGAHGEGSQAAGDLYQVSNAVSFGLAPAHIAGRVRPVADYLVAAERAARAEVADRQAARAVEFARDAWTRIERADRLSAGEALDALSRLRLAAAAELNPLGGHAPAPDPALFATLVAEMRTGAGLAASPPPGALPLAQTRDTSVRDAIQRPAKIRSALRRFYRNRPVSSGAVGETEVK